MSSHSIGHPESPAADPSLAGVASLMEREAAARGDVLAFDVSQLLSELAYAARDGEPAAVLLSAGHRLANAWLLTQSRPS